MFLFFSVISLPCNFCQINTASIGARFPFHDRTDMANIFSLLRTHLFKKACSFEKVSAEERKYIRHVSSVVEGESSSDAGCIYLAEIARQGNDREEQEHE